MKTFILSIPLFLIATISQAQQWELGGMYGGSNYMGDLSPTPFVLRETHTAWGLFIRYNYSSRWAFKLNYYKGKVSGNDLNQKDPELIARGLHFRSKLWEIGLNAEYNLTRYWCGSRKFSPYLFAGAALFHHNPRVLYFGQWAVLQPIYIDRSPAENVSRLGFAIPVGLGLKWNPYRNWHLGFEFGIRKTFTDFMDGFSNGLPPAESNSSGFTQSAEDIGGQNSDAGVNPHDASSSSAQTFDLFFYDWYIFAGFTLSYTFGCRGSGGGENNESKKAAQQKCFDFQK